jgi:hypothetical protein
MGNDTNDPVSDVVENLPDMASGNENKPAGTVVSADGERVTLGEEPSHNTNFSSTRSSMNKVDKGK